MTPERYGTFLVFAALLTIAPGPDLAVVLKNALGGGTLPGWLTSLGVVTSNVVHGTLASFGLGAVIVRSQGLFSAIRWVGAAYLLVLGVQALRSAWHGRYPSPSADVEVATQRRRAARGWRQGFLSNITNPKVLAFYLSVLPQFMRPGGSAAESLLLSYSHALLSLLWLSALVVGLDRVGVLLRRRPVRRTLDGATGLALIGFGAVVAREAA